MKSINPFIENNGLMPGKPLPVVKNAWLGITVLFVLFVGLLMVLSFIVALISNGADESKMTMIMRVSTVLQDILVFILPALVAALVVTRLPATLLRLDVKPKFVTLSLFCLVFVTSIPAMEWLIMLNQNLHLPESLSGLEETLRGMENNAESAISMLQGQGIGNLIFSVLVIGVLTGLSEELFFRGAFQNLMFSTKMKKHLAVWTAAIVFSFLHFQFFGFLPRMLLGAYFGYALWWTGSVWTSVALHALNNSIYAVSLWIKGNFADNEVVEQAIEAQVDGDTITIILSFVVTIFGIYILRRRTSREALAEKK